jgi:hypothetical protein
MFAASSSCMDVGRRKTLSAFFASTTVGIEFLVNYHDKTSRGTSSRSASGWKSLDVFPKAMSSGSVVMLLLLLFPLICPSVSERLPESRYTFLLPASLFWSLSTPNLTAL